MLEAGGMGIFKAGQRVKRMKVFVEVITAPNCPHSPKAFRAAQRIVTTMKDVVLEEVNTITQQGQERADSYGIKSTPVIAINGRVAYVGLPKEPELKHMIEMALREERDRQNYYL